MCQAIRRCSSTACPAFLYPATYLRRSVGVDVVTLGQYMRPTKKHMAVSEFVTPEAFDGYAKVGMMAHLP